MRPRKAKPSKQNKPTAEAENDRCIIVGIDFGATYSAVAYTPVSKKAFLARDLVPLTAEEVLMVRHEDSLHSDEREAPSQMKYDVDKAGSEPQSYGYTVENDRRVKSKSNSLRKLAYPKLLLSEKAESKEFLRSTRSISNMIQKGGESIVADYLKQLIASLDKQISKDLISHSDVDRFYFCGYPPAWPEHDIEKLMRACEEAGMLNVHMVSEPTAAATALLGGMSETRLLNYGLRAGETFLLIDAGGMTVEFTVFKILGVKPIAVEQLTVGHGDYCGSGYCNLGFYDRVLKDPRLPDVPLENREKIADYAANVEFEYLVKRNLKPTDDPREMKFVRLPPEHFPKLEPYLRDNNNPTSRALGWVKTPEYLEFSRQELGQFLEKSFQTTLRLARKQIQAAKDMEYNTSKVILTGGFGRNELLQYKIKEALSTQRQNVEIIQPAQPIGAVAQGILSMALNQSAIKKSRMRYSLGIDEKQEFTEGRHKEDVRYFQNGNGPRMVESIRWLLKRGDEITFNQKKTLPRQVEISLNGDWKLTTEIITSTETSEDYLDRFAEHIGKPSTEKGQRNYDIRPDCWCMKILMVDLSGLSDDDKRVYLGLQSTKKRKGTFEFDIEYVVRHDRLEFWMVPKKGPQRKWKMVSHDPETGEIEDDDVDPNQYDRYQKSELSFPQPTKEKVLSESLGDLSIEAPNQATTNADHPRRHSKLRSRTARRRPPITETGHLWSPPDSPQPSESTVRADSPVTPRKRQFDSGSNQQKVQRQPFAQEQQHLSRNPASRNMMLSNSTTNGPLMSGAVPRDEVPSSPAIEDPPCLPTPPPNKRQKISSKVPSQMSSLVS
ncbi:MAG: hypothetical protein Q9227_006743 [Pyrenula ochraceoflavens]